MNQADAAGADDTHAEDAVVGQLHGRLPTSRRCDKQGMRRAKKRKHRKKAHSGRQSDMAATVSREMKHLFP